MPLWLSKKRRFCSKLCNGARRRKETAKKYQVECLTCGKSFKKAHASAGKYCSYWCYWKSLKVHGEKPECIDCGKQLTAHHCQRCLVCQEKYMVGEKHGQWKGDEVGYGSLHKWVSRWLGKPNKCSECGKVGYGRQIHWANKSGEYKRDLSDWIRLCAKCHGEYDSRNGIRRNSLTLKI